GSVIAGGGIAGMRSDPTLWALVSPDFYEPVMYSNAGANRFPVEGLSSETAETHGRTLVWTLRDTAGRARIRETAELRPRGIRLTYAVVGKILPNRPWSIWYYPGYGGTFTGISESPNSVEGQATINGEVVAFRVATATGNLSYHGANSALQTPEGINLTAGEDGAFGLT